MVGHSPQYLDHRQQQCPDHSDHWRLLVAGGEGRRCVRAGRAWGGDWRENGGLEALFEGWGIRDKRWARWVGAARRSHDIAWADT